MPRPKKKPTTFDGWLGQVIGSLADSYGGSAMMAELTGTSTTSIHRRLRGEIPFFTSEVTLIANEVKTPVEWIVTEALRRYGEGDTNLGFTRLLSEGSSTKEDYQTKQAEASAMTAEEIEDRNRYELAATDDADQRRDESGYDPDAPPAN